MVYSALVGECVVGRGGVEEDWEGENGEGLPPGVDLWESGRDCPLLLGSEKGNEKREKEEEGR